jgi:putative acetyltransferase
MGIKMNQILITRGDPNNPSIIAMMDDADAYYANLYPSESNHLIDSQSLSQANVSFYVACINDRIMGFGALLNCLEEYGEIKRMYVTPEARKTGVGIKILRTLEQCAIDQNLRYIRLETGVKQPEAIGLYRSFGYKNIPAFGSYLPDPLSLFMEKLLP